MNYGANLTQLYMEMSRAAFEFPLVGIGQVEVTDDEAQAYYQIQLAWVTHTLLYSYLAVESFYVKRLYCAWNGDDGEKARSSVQKLVGSFSDFTALCEENRVRKLKGCIKTVLDIHGLRQIHEGDPKLWADFKDIVKDHRDFVVHPKPDPERYQKFACAIMERFRAGLYSDIATNVIRHFFTEGGWQQPGWLAENKLFTISGVNVLGDGSSRCFPNLAVKHRNSQPSIPSAKGTDEMKRTLISSGSPYEKTVGFSRAVRVGDRIIVSGTAPIMPDGSSCTGNAYEQAKRCFEIIKQAIEEAGGSINDVVRTRMYLTDATVADDVSRAHGEFFANIRPAATMVVVSGLLRPEWLVEIEADAIVV